MSAAKESNDEEYENSESLKTPTKNGTPLEANEVDESEDEDQEEDEPRLKYTKLTGNLSTVYKNGDDTSCFLVAGDKLIMGTHNGNIHSLSLPSLASLRTYHAHSASVTALSISPVPPPPTLGVPTPIARTTTDSTASVQSPSAKSKTPSSPSTVKKPPVPNIPANQIYIASASQDGHVCVTSLVDPKDVTLRNFARPVQAVALSPEYKYDRTYLSGGLAGSLILTVDGKPGMSSDANTNSAAAAAQGWLGSLGLSSNTGKDTVLHSGEGGIAAIKFSRTGRFAAWINEHGIKIMRSHMKLDSTELQYAWKRIAHIDRPDRDNWQDMAAVWKGRMEWVSNKQLETDDEVSAPPNGPSTTPSKHNAHKRNPEKLIAGWGDTAWILHVYPGGTGIGRNAGEKLAGSADIVHKLSFDDCILSGLALYTPSLLAVLAYRTRDDNDKPITSNQEGTPWRHRQNALSPELRLVEVATGEEVDVDTLTVSRYESLSVTDYHLGSIYIPTPPALGPAQRGALESLGAVGAGIWDMSSNATRIFSSGASVRSNAASGENGRGSLLSPPMSVMNAASASVQPAPQGPPALSSPGLKLFIQTPYDCVLAVKRDLSDHLTWLLDHTKYGQAWDLLDNHPGIVRTTTSLPSNTELSTPSTPSGREPRTNSLADFFADDSASQTTLSAARNPNSALSKEKRRIADLWLQQLVSANQWTRAGEVAGKVLSSSARWEHWILAFAQAEKFDEITPYIPAGDMRPPLPSFVYEVVLGHYITHDAARFGELLDKWDTGLFDVGSVATAVETRLAGGDVDKGGEEWRYLMEGLARLKLTGGQARQALGCYIQLQNAEEAMRLIKEWRLSDAVADDVPGLLMLRVSKEVMDKGSREELMTASEEAIGLLVDEAYSGIVPPATVVAQMRSRGKTFEVFLYFYFKRLWEGPPKDEDRLVSKVERLNLERLTTEGRIIVESFADLALEVFAKYERDLLFLYLRTSTAYTLDKAVGICEEKEYIPELVFLLSKTGETKKALFLIIEKLGDVVQAIEFAKENADLWDDLLNYSMDKPKFIRALLMEVGTSVDAIKLVKRIPDGLEIEGLKEGLQKLVREYDIQFSISEGVAKVLRGEVAVGMETLREGRRKGVKFEVRHRGGEEVAIKIDPALNAIDEETKKQAGDLNRDTMVKNEARHVPPGHCVSCEELFEEEESDFLIGFACGHVFHLECLLDKLKAHKEAYALVENLRDQTRTDTEADSSPEAVAGAMTRSVGPKISHAQVIRSAIGGGCPVCISAQQ
ncbi:vacuolar assembly protein-like protein [Elsinoe ampelina]|uniref:Vacuolar assembly protein-like protein n=1 Tax=Elsinoe ampelina TaxID=302913 RepID=A0A6A6GFM4_9PEZI|nr:vacuolar assembly protein-like protein [Elsinoe ampelina]